jgi:hypothetical protein
VQAGASDETLDGAAAPRARPKTPIRPALDGDAPFAKNAELVANGFPPRPDPTNAPQAHARWLEIVSRPAARLTPRFVYRGESRAAVVTRLTSSVNGLEATGTSSNWCGFVLTNPRTVYWYMEGQWSVPAVVPHSGFFLGPWYFEYSSQWLGLDGLNTPDVVQAGSEQDTYTAFGWTFTSYYLFTENYPAASVGAQIGVDPGDVVEGFVWVGNSSGEPDVSGGYGWYYLYDVTQGTYSSSSSPLAAPFSGATAEWILERPSVPVVSYGLANFGRAQMGSTYAFDSNWQYHDLGTDANVQLTMVNGQDKLCYTYETSTSSAGYVWTGYN